MAELNIEDTEAEEVVYVRDRRRSERYPIQNIIMDEWRPLIGPVGLDIYNLLSRVSMYKHGERARISFNIFQNFLGHSRATVWTYLRLLELCNLIHRESSGGEIIQNGKVVKKRNNKPNYYYILEPKSVTKEVLEELKGSINLDQKMDENFKSYFFELIEGWKSFQLYSVTTTTSKVKPVVGQRSLFDDSEEGDTEDDNSPPTPSINPIVKRILETVNIRDEKIVTEFSIYEPSMILAVIWHGRTEKWVNPERFSGYVIKTLRSGTIPPHGFITFAEQWLEWTKNQRKEFSGLQWAYLRSYDPAELAEELDMSEPIATSVLALIKSESFSSFNNWTDIT